jgi:hypothetical protein
MIELTSRPLPMPVDVIVPVLLLEVDELTVMRESFDGVFDFYRRAPAGLEGGKRLVSGARCATGADRGPNEDAPRRPGSDRCIPRA